MITTAQELTRNTIESSNSKTKPLFNGWFFYEYKSKHIYRVIYMEGKLNRYELVFDEETMEGVCSLTC
jgi:hypothetical protein